MSRSLNLAVSRRLDLRLRPETKHLIILIVAAAATLIPTLIWGIPSNHDLSNHFRFALPFHDALRSGNLYPGWLADSNHGFGDASFRFYPPALYYLLALVKMAAGSWYAATVVTFAALSVLGALGVYLWTREFAPSETAMLAGIFFAVAPYRLNQFFQATLLAEFAGAAVLPFVFAFAVRLCRHGGRKNIAGLAAAYALLVLTHLPLAVIGSLALGGYALLSLEKGRRLRALSQLGAAICIGLLASASYWTTMLAELHWIRADNINPDPSVDYRKNFVLSTLSPDYLNVWWMNILLLASLAMFWPAIVIFFKKSAPLSSNRRRIYGLGIFMLLTLFMATPLSQPIWMILSPLQQTQFPWRWLSITSMVMAMMLAMAIPFWKRVAESKRRPMLILAAGTVLISFGFSAFHIIREATWLTPTEFQQTLDSIPGSQGVTQWWPVWVHEPLPKMDEPVEVMNRATVIDRWLPEQRTFHVAAGETTEARVRTFFYPHWKASAGNRDLPVRPDANGALLITLPKEAAEIKLEFREPPRSRYAAGFSLLGWALVLGLSFGRKQSLKN